MLRRNADCGMPGLRNVKTKMLAAFLFVGILITFSSCEEDYTPKPRGFERISFPERTYKDYSSECIFSMKYRCMPMLCLICIPMLKNAGTT
jgi:hypothetical protein